MKQQLKIILVALALAGSSMQIFAAPEAPILTYSINGFTVTASWTAVSGASEYVLSYAPNPYTGPDSIASLNVGNQTGFSATLWEGAAFYIAVQASNEQGLSEYSNIQSFAIASSAANLSGDWTMTQTIGPNNCGISVGKVEDFTAVVVHTDTSLTAQTPYALYSGIVTGNTATLSGSFHLDGATETNTLSLTVLPDENSVSGSISTTVIFGGFSCSAVSSITGNKID